jgi:CRP-like cAMP-binding protein
MSEFKSHTYADGETIFAIGDLAEHLYFIEKGQVDLVNAQAHVFASATAGQSFGEAAILQGGVRSAGARANGEVDCRRITAEEASELLLSHSPILLLILEALLLQQSMQNTLRNP